MPPLILKGNTLGEKHKHFNKLVQDAVAKKQYDVPKINGNDSDIDNLVKIDTACKFRNLSYVIDVLKCDDILYVSKAIKQSMWLITEEQYANIINPEYLFTQLFPYMLAKAINKLLLRIRLHLKDERRVEGFFIYLNHQSGFNVAEKWLVNCSIPFIENVLQNRRDISFYVYTRLCSRSVKFLQYYTKVEDRDKWRALPSVLFLAKTDTEEFLNVIEKAHDYSFPPLGRKYTEVIMKKYPNRILNNFDKYKTFVNLSMVAKYMKKEDVKDFVLKNSKNNNMKHFFSNYENLKHFIKTIPREERFQFVKSIYIDKNVITPAPISGDLMYCDSTSACLPSCTISSYNWYQYAPFNEAFIELKKLIRTESSSAERCSMLSVLLTCARKNPQNIKIVLEYFYNKHRNEPFKFKIQFVNSVIKQIDTYNFDSQTWNILDKLFYSLEVYIESENNVQTCLKAIVLYKVLRNETVPEIVTKKITFDTFKHIQNKLNAQQRAKLFSYLLSSVSTKIENNSITSESSFDKSISLLTDALNLLTDWKKNLKEYPVIFDKIQELIKLKKENVWNTELTSLYEINKSWRRDMFEESLMMYPSEEVCLNALKHDPQLLVRYSDKVAEMRIDDKISLCRLCAKLRIYWHTSLAQEWTDAYLSNLNKSTGHKAIIKGLLVLLPREEVINIARKYTPKEPKIDWSEIDQKEFSLRKNIAKSLYLARPLPSLDLVLWYAKGDYLQFAVPSLNSIIHNISKVQSHDHMSKLLEAPVSLQKYGLHLAFIKLKNEELKPIFSDIWKNTKNSTIRTHLFTHIYNLLCTIKDPYLVRELWELLSMYMDNVAADENKIIYSKLGKGKFVHVCIQGQFFMKSYSILSSLPPAANCEIHRDSLIHYAPDIIDLLDADFVENKMLGSIKEQLTKPRFQFTGIISSYILHGKTEDEQCERYKRVLAPVLEHALTTWNTVVEGEYVTRENIDALTKGLTWCIKKYLPAKKLIIPVKLFLEIEKFIAEKLSITDNYERYTCWKLTTEYVKLLAPHMGMFYDPTLDKLTPSDYGTGWLPDAAENVWQAVHMKVSQKYGPIITRILKEDTRKFFPTICWLFSGALNKTFNNLSFRENLMKMETLKHMVLKDDFIPSCIVVCEEMPGGHYGSDDEKRKLREIIGILSLHPSLQVKMHCQKVFGDIAHLAS